MEKRGIIGPHRCSMCFNALFGRHGEARLQDLHCFLSGEGRLQTFPYRPGGGDSAAFPTLLHICLLISPRFGGILTIRGEISLCSCSFMISIYSRSCKLLLGGFSLRNAYILVTFSLTFTPSMQGYSVSLVRPSATLLVLMILHNYKVEIPTQESLPHSDAPLGYRNDGSKISSSFEWYRQLDLKTIPIQLSVCCPIVYMPLAVTFSF